METEKLILTGFAGAMLSHDPENRVLEMKNRYSGGIVIPLDGVIRFSRNGRELTADVHHPVLLPDGASYRNECVREAHSIVFNVRLFDPPEWCQPLPEADLADARAVFDRVSLLSETGASVQSILAELYGLLGRMLTPSPRTETERKLEPALARMLRDYGDPTLDAASLADAARVSPAWLRKLFLRQYGMPPIRYLHRLRMERAAVLLREGRPVKEVAAQVGYSDIYQFSRAVKKYFGRTPGAMRDRDRENSPPAEQC